MAAADSCSDHHDGHTLTGDHREVLFVVHRMRLQVLVTPSPSHVLPGPARGESTGWPRLILVPQLVFFMHGHNPSSESP